MNVRSLLVIFVLAAGLLPAAADDMPPKGADPAAPETQPVDKDQSIDPQERHTLESFGAQNKTCLEWSDGCAVCQRQDGEKFACSLPGIACEPGGLVCRRDDKSEPKPAPSGK